MDSVDEYQQRAEDCLHLARLMPTEQDRRTMLAAARRWRALAAQPGTLVVHGNKRVAAAGAHSPVNP